MRELQHGWRRLRLLVWKSPEPVTRTIIAIDALTFLVYFIVAFMAGAGNPWAWLDFSTAAPWVKPWSLVTYPLVMYSPLGLLLAGYWLWVVGGTLERSWTSRVFLRFFLGIAFVTSFSLWIGSLLLGLAPGVVGRPLVELSGLWMPLAALTVSWCLLNPDQLVLLGFVLPIKGRVLMWIVIGLTYFLFAFGSGSAWLAFFALAGIAAAYFYTQRKNRWIYARQVRSRAPNALERALDWVLYYWERFRRRSRRRW